MKKITLTLGLAAALCSGCSQSDNAKIDALSQKLDAVLQNQATINARLDALPTTKQIDGMSFYYHTNELNSMFVVEEYLKDSSMRNVAELKLDIYSNYVTVAQSKLQLDGIQRELFSANQSIVKIQTDMNELKIRLGMQVSP